MVRVSVLTCTAVIFASETYGIYASMFLHVNVTPGRFDLGQDGGRGRWTREHLTAQWSQHYLRAHEVRGEPLAAKDLDLPNVRARPDMQRFADRR